MVSVIILAAGEGKRMRSKIPKVLHPLLGKPMLAYGIEATSPLNPVEKVLVVNPTVYDALSEWDSEISFTLVIQDPPRGTADAVKCGLSALSASSENVLILPGDVPMISPETLKELVDTHKASGATLTILGAEMVDPFGYGRIITDGADSVIRIVEERDASPEEKAVRLVNTGFMIVKTKALRDALNKIGTDNAQGEFYLTDLAAIFHDKGLKVMVRACENPTETSGINDRRQLWEIQRHLLSQLIQRWQTEGVTFTNPETVYIEPSVSIGRDTVIEPGVYLQGETEIGEDCRIGQGAVIENSVLSENVVIKPYSVIEESVIDAGASIGPFAHLRPGSEIGKKAKVGNFVEVKKSKLAPGVKASHLTYIGDTTIGENTNIGAGTITCNYDGKRKHPTTIGKDVFVGSNTALVAPITVGDGSTIAAGSVITKKIPPHTLAVGRARQQNIYRHKRRKKEK